MAVKKGERKTVHRIQNQQTNTKKVMTCMSGVSSCCIGFAASPGTLPSSLVCLMLVYCMWILSINRRAAQTYSQQVMPVRQTVDIGQYNIKQRIGIVVEVVPRNLLRGCCYYSLSNQNPLLYFYQYNRAIYLCSINTWFWDVFERPCDKIELASAKCYTVTREERLQEKLLQYYRLWRFFYSWICAIIINIIIQIGST